MLEAGKQMEEDQREGKPKLAVGEVQKQINLFHKTSKMFRNEAHHILLELGYIWAENKWIG